MSDLKCVSIKCENQIKGFAQRTGCKRARAHESAPTRIIFLVCILHTSCHEVFSMYDFQDLNFGLPIPVSDRSHIIDIRPKPKFSFPTQYLKSVLPNIMSYLEIGREIELQISNQNQKLPIPECEFDINCHFDSIIYFFGKFLFPNANLSCQKL